MPADVLVRINKPFARAVADVDAVVAAGGRMVDIPVVERARLVLERAATIAAVEERQRVALARLGATPG